MVLVKISLFGNLQNTNLFFDQKNRQTMDETKGDYET
jgi:hypothetical protein